MKKLDFETSYPKSLAALHYLASIHNGVSPYYVCKIFYYAEKEHLLDWGRTICGDSYIAMKHGPVPSDIYDLIKRDSFVPDELVEQFETIIEIKGNRSNLYPKVPYKRGVLSQTDEEYLASSNKTYGYMPFKALEDLVHEEKAWRNAWSQRTGNAGAINMADMIDDDFPEAAKFVDELHDKSAYATC